MQALAGVIVARMQPAFPVRWRKEENINTMDAGIPRMTNMIAVPGHLCVSVAQELSELLMGAGNNEWVISPRQPWN